MGCSFKNKPELSTLSSSNTRSFDTLQRRPQHWNCSCPQGAPAGSRSLGLRGFILLALPTQEQTFCPLIYLIYHLLTAAVCGAGKPALVGDQEELGKGQRGMRLTFLSTSVPPQGVTSLFSLFLIFKHIYKTSCRVLFIPSGSHTLQHPCMCVLSPCE